MGKIFKKGQKLNVKKFLNERKSSTPWVKLQNEMLTDEAERKKYNNKNADASLRKQDSHHREIIIGNSSQQKRKNLKPEINNSKEEPKDNKSKGELSLQIEETIMSRVKAGKLLTLNQNNMLKGAITKQIIGNQKLNLRKMLSLNKKGGIIRKRHLHNLQGKK